MPVPSTITDLSATAASNSPAGGDAVFPDLDNYLRSHAALIRYGDTKASDVASAATTDIGASVGRVVDVTGTTQILSFGTVAAGVWRIVRFTGALVLTHNATSLILPGRTNITTAAGDTCVAVSLGSGNWLVTDYQAAVWPEFRAEQNTLKTSGTVITYDVEVFDVGGALNASTGVFTAPAAGTYHFAATWDFNNGNGSTTQFVMQFAVNGSSVVYVRCNVPASTTGGGTLAATLQLAASDQVRVERNAAFTANESVSRTVFTGHRVR